MYHEMKYLKVETVQTNPPEEAMKFEITKQQLDTAAKNMADGNTLQEEAKRLGFKRGKILRRALREHVGKAAYSALVRGGGKKKGGTKAKAKAKPAAKKAAAKPAAKKAAAKPKAKAKAAPRKSGPPSKVNKPTATESQEEQGVEAATAAES